MASSIMASSSSTTEPTTIEVKCGDRACTTGQTITAADNTARKVVSHFFGRNKSATKGVEFPVWHLVCRMSYQRDRYAAQKLGPKSLCQYFINHLMNQFIRLRLWRPNATFNIQLWSPAKKRLNRYNSLLLRGSSKESATEQVTVTPAVNKDGWKPKVLGESDAVTMDHAEYIDNNFSGPNRSIDYIVDTVVPWIQQEIDSGAMLQMPPIEFLINTPVAGDIITDPLTNFARWETHMDGREYVEQPTQTAIATPEGKLPKLVRLGPPTPVKLNLSLARFRISEDTSCKGKAPATETSAAASTAPEGRPADELPLYQPPSSSALHALRKTSKAQKLSIDTKLANSSLMSSAQYSDEDTEPDSSRTVVSGTPIMARGMVYAAGKPKLVCRKRSLDENYDDEETEGDGEGPASKKVKV